MSSVISNLIFLVKQICLSYFFKIVGKKQGISIVFCRKIHPCHVACRNSLCIDDIYVCNSIYDQVFTNNRYACVKGVSTTNFQLTDP